MKIIDQGLFKFDYYLPINNWIYPVGDKRVIDGRKNRLVKISDAVSESPINSLALYFHIPFCQSICTFCTFERSQLKENSWLERYTQALVKEIRLKARYSAFTRLPVKAIFFGGGTPSVLTPAQITRIGAALKDSFNLNRLKEFSVEMGLATISDEKLEAFTSIGATHARFGVQTFLPQYRAFFNLSPDLDPVYRAAVALKRYFPYISFDMMYGFNGQTDEDFVSDIQKAAHLGFSNIDVYPINDLATQPCLQHAYQTQGLSPSSGTRKFILNVLLRRIMWANGYLPHNGHGYVKVDKAEIKRNPVVTNKYSFIYHDHVYGYRELALLGFGANAISSLDKYTMRNQRLWSKYTNNLQDHNDLDFEIGEHDLYTDCSKPLAMRLPYHGRVNKKLIDWEHVHPETIASLTAAIKSGLIIEKKDDLELTEDGWNWYHNLMYFLSPPAEKQVIDRFIARAYADPAQFLGEKEIPLVT
ncbi:MAG: radical SAM protein [Dehalococcoidales bacterium]|nr:radical SAM protein [Dehalococcoidales bacterium]